MSIAVRVQAHPSRRDLHGPLAERLAPLPVEIFEHASDPPDPWAGYRRCLSDLPACSHVLIIQDDALPCKNFVPALEQIAEKVPTYPVCLFMGALPASTAGKARQIMKRGTNRYVPLGSAPFVPLVAVLWPRAKGEDFLEWSKTSRRITRADDGNAARWMIRSKQPILVTVPSLVDHNDDLPSVKGGRDSQGESWRKALFVAEDALAYQW